MRASLLRGALSAACLTMGLSLAGCATAPQAAEDDPYQVDDPLETVNRGIFSFNDAFDEYLLHPVAVGYRDVLPGGVRDAIRHFLDNLRSPIILANDLLQGEGKRASDTAARLLVNTTVGIGGIFDVATKAGVPYHDADFGQTFGIWGVPAGPYIVLPILGPSDPRDAVGMVAANYADPGNAVASAEHYTWVIYARDAVDAIDQRARYLGVLDRMKSTSLDYYAAMRSLYRQRRAAMIRHEEAPPGYPDISR